MKKFRLNTIQFGCVLLLMLTACSNEPSITEEEIQGTVNAAVQGTTIALAPPTFTPIPTITLPPTVLAEGESVEEPVEVDPAEPTETPLPTATHTPIPTDTPSAPFIKTELGDGTIRYDLPLDGFALTLSDDWVVADFYQEGETAEQRQLEELLGSGIFRNLIAAGVKFYAINWSEPSLASLSPININVTILPNEAASLEEASTNFADEIAYQLDLFPSDLLVSSSELGGIPTQRIEYTFIQPSPLERDFTLQLVHHLVQKEDQLLLITLTIPTELAEQFLATAEADLQSLELFGQ